jgi:hypothetical protein
VTVPPLTRRTFLLAALAAAAAPSALRFARRRGYDVDRRRAYQALVEGLLAAGALPDPPASAPAAGERLAGLYADALPRRRREMDDVLDELARADLPRRAPADRVALLRDWAAAGGDQRILAARATALAAAAYGPTDRALPVVI